MPVSALSTAGFSQYITATSDLAASQHSWQSLQNSLAAGNLSAAQSAFKTYNRVNPTASSSSGSSTSSQYSTDMTALGSALSSGNLSQAQSALATVQSDLNTNPALVMANAETAVKQTVQWIEDLISLSNLTNSSSSSTLADPFISMLNSAYGLNNSSSKTDPMVTFLESKYAVDSAPSTGSTDAATTGNTATTKTIASSGNSGSSASVNKYA